jgi:ATP-dependent DNA helicase DinG
MSEINIISEGKGTVMDSELRQDSEDFLQFVVTGELEDYELRHSQIEMMGACSDIIETGGILIAEAGTGTGKTFAYLIPLILSGKKAIVTTRTKNLQEQLVSRDLKFLSSLREFDYAIAKGRGNYLCLRRLKAFVPSNKEEASNHQSLLEWSSDTGTGDFEEYQVKKSPLHDKVCSDPDACKRLKCPYFRDCHYFKARRKWDDARIVVVNHALLTVNAMMPSDSKILPQAGVLVIDEAHALDNVLSEQIGINLSKTRFENILNRFLKLDERGAYKGLLSKSQNLFTPVESLRTEMGLFWDRVSDELNNRTLVRGMFKLSDLMLTLTGSVRSLIENIRMSTIGLFEEDEEIELSASVIKLASFADEMETFARGMEGFVRWPEIEERRIALRMAPIYPKEFVRGNIVPDYESLILTSATLSVGGDFSLTQNVLGLDDARTVSLPSPFDLRNQVAIVVNRGINLREDNEAVEKLSRVILDEASKQDGGILVLFTSREIMNRAWGFVADELKETGFYPMLQGELPNRTMLEIMRDSTNGVIFGLESFWEGVDVKGDSLKCLIITKLPFEVPTEPMVSARVETIRRSGRDPFNEYTLPKAILKFKQGFGRLIRSRNDTGRVIICDERIETKGYGRRFIESIF